MASKKPVAASKRYAAQRRAEAMRPVFAELADMSHKKAAEELNQRSIKGPGGGKKWDAPMVRRVRQRLTAPPPSFKNFLKD